MNSPTQRFSSRVENYVKYRPTYPREVIELLERNCGLTPDSVVADLGSGTGFLTQLFLEFGCRVFGVEPNKEMREAGEHFLRDYLHLESDGDERNGFISLNGTAEATSLPDRSVDFIVAGQSFHWFNVNEARREFRRILQPRGWVALIWNARQIDTSPFLRAYENLLLAYCAEYNEVAARYADTTGLEIDFKYATFENAQYFDFDGLKGRLLSSSYAPEESHPNHSLMLDELRRIFDAHQTNGTVAFLYTTEVFYGRIQ
jgi:SAM-dependent methyltransferase